MSDWRQADSIWKEVLVSFLNGAIELTAAVGNCMFSQCTIRHPLTPDHQTTFSTTRSEHILDWSDISDLTLTNNIDLPVWLEGVGILCMCALFTLSSSA